jgi:hypothetical protein
VIKLINFFARIGLTLFPLAASQSFAQIVITIDNFNSGGPTPAATSSFASFPGDPDDIVGGSREVFFFGTSATPPHTVEVTGGNLEIEVFQQNTLLGSVAWGAALLGTAPLNLDLSGADRFELAVPPTSPFFNSVKVVVNGTEHDFPTVLAGGKVTMFFSEFGGSVNFADVDLIRLDFSGAPLPGLYQINSFAAAIPEPEHGMLVVAFALGAYALYTRSRACLRTASPR